MKCDVCENEAESGHIIPGWGFACSEDCSQILNGKRKAHYNELKSEPLAQMPDAFHTGDFERWTLKLAIQFLETLDAKGRKKLAKASPLFLIPEQLALDFKNRILRNLNQAYVSSVENKGHARLFCGGTYCLRQPVPRDVIIKAAQAAQLIGQTN